MGRPTLAVPDQPRAGHVGHRPAQAAVQDRHRAGHRDQHSDRAQHEQCARGAGSPPPGQAQGAVEREGRDHGVTVTAVLPGPVRTGFQEASDATIADKMPKQYLVGDREGYVKALDAGKAMFTADGVMPEGGPETVLAVLSGFSKNVKGKTIDLSETYTTEFVKAAK